MDTITYDGPLSVLYRTNSYVENGQSYALPDCILPGFSDIMPTPESNVWVAVVDDGKGGIAFAPYIELTAAERVLLAKERHLCTLIMDYSPTMTPQREWRNFTVSLSGGSAIVQSRIGKVAEIKNTGSALVEYPIGRIPLTARGVIVAVQAFGPVGDAAYLYMSHDSSNHVINSVGVDRCTVDGSGATITTQVFFGNKQSLWCRVNRPGVTGRINLKGWIE